MQQSLLFIKQNPSNFRVIHVPRANLNCRQTAAALEGILPDADDSIRNDDARQAGAVTEGILPDTGDSIRNRDARQALAVIEGTLPDTGDTVRNRVICTCLASRISIQRSLLFIEQNSIDTRVIHVPRANLNLHQGAATTEGPIPDAGKAIRYRDAR